MPNLLVVTTLFPNRIQFRHGIFVETRLRRLLATGRFSATVIAPVPWFPLESERFPQYAQYAKVPALEERDGVTVHHPRYLVIPKIGMVLTPFFLAISLWRKARQLRRAGARFDLIDAHYYYPDGVSAAILARLLRLPLAVTARGSDINVLPQHVLPRRMIRWAAKCADASIAVSGALKETMVGLGVEPEKVHVLRNGVDLQQFRPLSEGELRKKYSLNRRTLCSVGNLVTLKGHDLVIRALPLLPTCELLIVGDGELRVDLERLVTELSVEDRVRFLGAVDQATLVEIYSVADILVLASSREGLPNVVLEAMACDTPVVATAVGGVPEVVQAPEAGVLLKQRDVDSLRAGVQTLLDDYPEEGKTRAYAERFSWDQTIDELGGLLQRLAFTAADKN